ncbi:MAG: CoA transferase [Proteobacteria bacterium]|nr:CoA transferase [Pseudomonadota bacterium]
MKGALAGIRVLDLSRVLAGPLCTQILGDLGADVIKVEKPGEGDDTRKWGPPYLKDAAGRDTGESAYYLSCNRNKRSVSIDISKPEGQDIIHGLLKKSDVVIENFKTGGLKKYGLDFESVHGRHPHIVYCSITGFGQTGPLADEPGYDFVAQAMGGLMAATGAPGGEPIKAGVALSDVMTGLYAATGILAALRHRDETGKGQMVDLALTDCTLAGTVNIAQYYLTSGKTAPRVGNAHPTIVPYQSFKTADGHIVIAIGNDAQFRRFAKILNQDWAGNEKFATNPARVENRDALASLIATLIARETTARWIESFRAIDVPAGPVNTMDRVFAEEQIKAREMKITLPHAQSGLLADLVGSPLKLSETPVVYEYAPPVLGQDTDVVLKTLLGATDAEIKELRGKGIL